MQFGNVSNPGSSIYGNTASSASSATSHNAMDIDNYGAIPHPFTTNLMLAQQGNNPTACRIVGDAYRTGIAGVVQQDLTQAFGWYGEAAKGGDPEAINHRGICFLKGYGVSQDLGKAKECFEIAGALNNADAKCNLGEMYFKKKIADPDGSLAEQYFEEAASQGHPKAKYRLADMSEDWGVILELANQGYTKALNLLGDYYYCGGNGNGDCNYDKAFKCYSIAAAAGHRTALNNLGVCYENGQGVQKNDHAAFLCYEAAALKGSAVGMGSLGRSYFEGIGTPTDYEKAVQWLVESDRRESIPEVWTTLGICYYEGKGVEQDFNRAFQFFLRSVQIGDRTAMYKLATCYYHGHGVPKNEDKADEWDLIASRISD